MSDSFERGLAGRPPEVGKWLEVAPSAIMPPSPHFNQLTPGQAERLALLAEECGEVIQAVGKILRHGYDSCHPETGVSNADALRREVIDVFAVLNLMDFASDPGAGGTTDQELQESIDRKLKYCHHQHGEW